MNLLEELRALDPRDPGRWPLAFRAGAVGVCFVVVSARAQLLLRLERAAPGAAAAAGPGADAAPGVQDKHAKAVNLEVYKQQLKDIERPSARCCASCPARPKCRTCWSTSRRPASAAALEEKLFQPEAEVKKDFYAELPIKIRLTGSYHQFGEFVSGIAALPRIVTLHDI